MTEPLPVVHPKDGVLGHLRVVMIVLRRLQDPDDVHLAHPRLVVRVPDVPVGSAPTTGLVLGARRVLVDASNLQVGASVVHHLIADDFDHGT